MPSASRNNSIRKACMLLDLFLRNKSGVTVKDVKRLYNCTDKQARRWLNSFEETFPLVVEKQYIENIYVPARTLKYSLLPERKDELVKHKIFQTK